MDYIRKLVGFEVHSLFLNDLIQWVTSLQKPRLISTVKWKALQVYFPHGTEEPYSWSSSSKAAAEWHLCQVLRLQTARYLPTMFHAGASKDGFQLVSVRSLGCRFCWSLERRWETVPDVIWDLGIWQYASTRQKETGAVRWSDMLKTSHKCTPHYLEVNTHLNSPQCRKTWSPWWDIYMKGTHFVSQRGSSGGLLVVICPFVRLFWFLLPKSLKLTGLAQRYKSNPYLYDGF